VSSGNENHPANYRGCMVHKQIQQKTYPRLKERHTETRPIHTGVTYAQVVQGQPNTPEPNVAQPQPENDLTELKQMMKNFLDQMGTLIKTYISE
jgi:hypothetical protein